MWVYIFKFEISKIVTYYRFVFLKTSFYAARHNRCILKIRNVFRCELFEPSLSLLISPHIFIIWEYPGFFDNTCISWSLANSMPIHPSHNLISKCLTNEIVSRRLATVDKNRRRQFPNYFIKNNFYVGSTLVLLCKK